MAVPACCINKASGTGPPRHDETGPLALWRHSYPSTAGGNHPGQLTILGASRAGRQPVSVTGPTGTAAIGPSACCRCPTGCWLPNDPLGLQRYVQGWRSLRPGQPGRVAGRNRSSPRRSQPFPCGLAASPEGFLVTQTSVGSSRQRSRGGLVHPVNGCRGDAEFGGSRTIGSAGASPAGAFRWRCTAAVVGSSLTRETLYRGGILGDSIGSRVHLPLSVKRLGKNGRNIGLPEIGHTVIVMTDWYPSRR